jgi:hypothetical protein
MRSALLAGRDHATLGAIEVVAEGACAVALSRGGAAKTYFHTEPNEDACLFAVGPGGAVLAVADGHHGAIGAEIAMRHLLEHNAERWTAPSAGSPNELEREVSAAVSAANLAILDEAERSSLPPSPTTLCLVVIRPEDDILVHASAGDSHIFWTRDAGPVDIGWAAQSPERPAYLGYPPSAEHEAKRGIGTFPLAGTRSVVLVTDGFSEHGIGHDDPETELHAIQSQSLSCAADLRPIETCRGVAQSANQIQRKHRAGDNLGCAVWIAD